MDAKIVIDMYGGCSGVDEVKKRRRELLKENHPDSGNCIRYSIDEINESYSIACDNQIWCTDKNESSYGRSEYKRNIVVSYEEYKIFINYGYINVAGERVTKEIFQEDREMYVGIEYELEVTNEEVRQYKGEVYVKVDKIYGLKSNDRFYINYKVSTLKEIVEMKFKTLGKVFDRVTQASMLRFDLVEEDIKISFVMNRKLD